jgi:hypothetical protein
LQRNAFDLVGKEETGIIELLIFVFVLAVIYMPFSGVLGDFYTPPLGVFRTCQTLSPFMLSTSVLYKLIRANFSFY